jgi:formate/nitrite transporter FocA (FNT family)
MEGLKMAGAQKQPLDPDEEKKATEEESLTADITYAVICREGEKELERSLGALAWSGFAGGLAMAFTPICEALLRSHLPDTEWRPLVTKLGYPVGFLIVILGSQQLYTENTLRPVVPVLSTRDPALFRKMLRLWGIVLLANLLGGFLVALVTARTTLLDPAVRDAMAAIAADGVAPGFAAIFLRAIFAGWILAALMWMLPAAESSHVFVIAVMMYVMGIGQFSHVIAGSAGVFHLVVLGQLSLARALGGFTLPALLGNTIGGVMIVAALNHAQVTSGGG